MRTLAIGDIHGCLTALTTLLDFADPTPDDRLITLGDYVDRGPNTSGVLDLLIDWYAKGRLIALRGNHEEMMVASQTDEAAQRMWLLCGGRETLESYDPPTHYETIMDVVPDAHWHFLENVCVDWFETESHFFVHANARCDLPLNAQPRDVLLWEALYIPCVHISGKIMVCGHTRQPMFRPGNYGTTVCIDTNAHDPEGWLTCLDVESGQFWQANELGQRREGMLSPPNR